MKSIYKEHRPINKSALDPISDITITPKITGVPVRRQHQEIDEISYNNKYEYDRSIITSTTTPAVFNNDITEDSQQRTVDSRQ